MATKKPTSPAKRPARKTAAAAPAAAPAEPTCSVEMRESVAILTLRRPQTHNAFNAQLIRDLTETLEGLDRDPGVRVVILAGEGKSFCAGADLGWMREMAGYSRAQNLADARRLAKMLATLNNLSKPTIARVHGPAYGGGVGLVACCDIAVASYDAMFTFSEARLGLTPATISPYVVEAIGARQARRYFLTAERFTAAEAFRIGLVHDLTPADELDSRINEILGLLLVGGPAAQAECKELIRAVAHRPVTPAVMEDTARRIADIRSSPGGKEGVGAFLGKRSPTWIPERLRRS